MHKLKAIKEQLIECIENQINNNLACVDTKELGEAIDMIKDLEQAMYYCTKIKKMYNEDELHEYIEVKDYKSTKEEKCSICKKKYLESKKLKHDIAIQIQHLEKYIQELSNDIMAIVDNASAEEKTILQQKLSILATRIV